MRAARRDAKNREAEGSDAARLLRRRYRIALALIGVVVIAGAGVTQAVLAMTRADGQLVNVSGRQRMLSQRIASQSHQVVQALNAGDPAMLIAASERLRASITDLEAAHRALRDDELTTGFGQRTDAAIIARLEALTPLADDLVASGTLILEKAARPSMSSSGMDAAVRERLEKELGRVSARAEVFLPEMHEIVGMYEAASRRHAEGIAAVGWVSLGLGALTIVMSALVVFEPTARLITNQHEELGTLAERANAANEAKTRFLANMSHELRTPLTAILGYVEMLIASARDEKHKLWARTIEGNAQHLTDLVGDVLHVSQIESDRVTLKQRAFKPTAPLESAQAAAAPIIGKRPVTFLRDVPEGMPERVETDETRVRQILINLATNAAEFTRSGTITLRVRYENGHLEYAVIDTGAGIAEEDRGRIFEEFEQVDNTMTRRHGGVGLGLSISRGLARALGGTLTVESTLGEGSTFTLRVPAEAVDAEHGDREISEPRRDGQQPSALSVMAEAEGRRVLLVDDVAINRELFATILESLGFSVTKAINGADAVNIVDREGAGAFALVLMDMQMPILDGYRATPKLRGMGVRCPVIAITAHAGPEDRSRCLEIGCDDYMSKPFQREDLTRVCERWLATGAGERGDGTRAA